MQARELTFNNHVKALLLVSFRYGSGTFPTDIDLQRSLRVMHMSICMSNLCFEDWMCLLASSDRTDKVQHTLLHSRLESSVCIKLLRIKHSHIFAKRRWRIAKLVLSALRLEGINLPYEAIALSADVFSFPCFLICFFTSY